MTHCTDGCYSFGPLRCDAVIVGLGEATTARLEAAADRRAKWRDRWERSHGQRHRYASSITPTDERLRDITTAGAELAVARYVRREWSAELEPDACDVAGGIEVRWRADERYRPDLTLRPGLDTRDGAYVLVTGGRLVYVIRGWLPGSAARRDEYLMDRGNGRELWYVPQERLWPPYRLKEHA